MHRSRSFILIVCSLLLLAACGGKQAKPLPREVGRVIVVGMTADGIQLSAFENIYANTLRTEGDVVCLVATGLPELREGINSVSIIEAAEAAKAPYIIMNRMIAVDDSGSTSLDNLSGYISANTPIRRINADVGRIESRLFDVKTGNLIWMTTSDTVNPKGRLQDIADEAIDLAEDLADEELIKPVVLEGTDNEQLLIDSEATS